MLGLVTGGKAVLNILYVVVLTPIVGYLMMNDWPRMKRWLDDMVPRRGHDVVGQLWHEIDVKLSGFIRGQLLLSFLLGVIYSVALTIAGLNYGFLIRPRGRHRVAGAAGRLDDRPDRQPGRRVVPKPRPVLCRGDRRHFFSPASSSKPIS